MAKVIYEPKFHDCGDELPGGLITYTSANHRKTEGTVMQCSCGKLYRLSWNYQMQGVKWKRLGWFSRLIYRDLL